MKTPAYNRGSGADAKRRYGRKVDTSHRADGKPSIRDAWQCYEAVKAELTARITCSADYEQACRQAAAIAGV